MTCVDYVPTVFNDEKKRIVARSNPERADRAAKRRKHVDQNHTTQHLKLPILLAPDNGNYDFASVVLRATFWVACQLTWVNVCGLDL